MIQPVGSPLVPLASFKAAMRLDYLSKCCREASGKNNPRQTTVERLLHKITPYGIPFEDPLPLVPRFLDPTLQDITPFIPEEDIYKCTIYKSGEVGFKQEGQEEVCFIQAPNIPIDFDYLGKTKEHPLIVDLTAALLTVYSLELKKDEQIYPKDFMTGKVEEANLAVFRYMQNGGVTDQRAKNLLSIATWMDTSGKPIDFNVVSFINGAGFYADHADGAKLYMGAGHEFLPTEAIRDNAIANGFSEGDYISGRRGAIEAISHIQENYSLREPINPIVTASPMQNGLREARNIRILNEVAHDKKGTIYPNLILHRLGSPYLKSTDWHTPLVTGGSARQYIGVKTSPPIFHSQVLEDYPSIKYSGSEVLTGDDKNFALLWLWGAIKQLEKRKKEASDETYTRNGFHFIKGSNIHGLLGNVGFAPDRMIAGIIELSKWYHAKVENKSNADEHLANYLEIMLPYTAMSFYGFFGPYNYTQTYVQSIERAHIFAGIHDLNNGRVPPHRRSQFDGDGTPRQSVIDGGLLAHYALASGKSPEAIADIVKRNPNNMLLTN